MKTREHVQKRLQDFGLVPANITILEEPVLADEDLLKSEIAFTDMFRPQKMRVSFCPVMMRWCLLEILIFSEPPLRIIMIWPSRVTYLGTDLWGRQNWLVSHLCRVR